MMKQIRIAIMTLSVLSLGACKKTYNCTCTKPGQKDPEVSTWKLKEEDAMSNCNSLDAVYEEDSGNCALSEG